MTVADVRAALIAMALLVHVLVGLPAPAHLNARRFDNPVAKEELARWSAIAQRVGVSLSPRDIVDGVVDVGTVVGRFKSAVLAPVQPVLRLTGTGQAWGLFTYPDTFPHRLVVEARTGGSWVVVYAGLDPDHTFLRDILTYRRIRGVYDGNTRSPGDSWENFARWVSQEVFAHFPDATEVRVKFLRFHVTAPDGHADPQVEERHVRSFRRSGG